MAGLGYELIIRWDVEGGVQIEGTVHNKDALNIRHFAESKKGREKKGECC